MNVLFCFDHNLSPRLVQVLRILKHQNLTRVREHHRIDPGDPAIIELATRHGWILVTADARMQSQPSTAAAFRDRQITTLFIGSSLLRKSLVEQSVWFIRHWGEIAAEIPRAPRGTIFESRANQLLRRVGQ